MTEFTPYSPPAHLSDLAESRVPVFDQALRVLQTEDSLHLLVTGPTGRGKTTLLHHLQKHGPRLGRRHRLMVDTPALAASLYEPGSLSDWFSQLDQFFRTRSQALILLPDVELLVDGIGQEELRRLSRFFHALSKHQCQCLIATTATTASQLLKRSSFLGSLFTSLEPPTYPVVEVDAILLQHGVTLDTAALRHLCERYLADVSLPGSAIQLWQQATTIATQAGVPVTASHLHQAISERRGIPLEAIHGVNTVKLTALEQTLGQTIVGQEHAVATVNGVLKRAFAGLRNQERPIASFLFLGPSGVGKTELAKVLARTLYQTPRSFARLDMSEFSESHTVQRLIGAPPGYVGYEEGGQLTNPVAQEPYSLVLLDEIEKAHPKVFDVFLQLLDDGRLTDGRGVTVDFRHTVVVATSNIGLTEIVHATQTGRIADREAFIRDIMLPLLVEYFRPEFLNRFDAIVLFQSLSHAALATIAQHEVARLNHHLERRQLQVQLSENFLSQLCRDAYQPAFGARPLKRLMQERVETPLAARLIGETVHQGEVVTF